MSDSSNIPLQMPVGAIVKNPLSSDPHVFSVEQLNVQIKKLIEGELGTVWVQGEISNFKPHTSGHFYFSLKDSKSQITAVMFRGHNSRLKFRPHDGLEVVVRAKVTVYEPRGNYQIICEMMEPVGAGALQKAYEQLKEKLKNEGLFDSARKKTIPALPRHVAIVTSPTGAAIRDILNILQRRAPSLPVTIVPSLVQGDGAAESLREAFLKAQRLPNTDVIIIGRGGGSIEDLWSFNDEKLARLIAACEIPVISAVGHEIDFTICDFVSDLRAPTPSAAAELVAKSNLEIQQKLNNLNRVLNLSIEKLIKFKMNRIELLKHKLVDPQKILQNFSQRNDELMDRLQLAMEHVFSHRKHDVDLLAEKLKSPKEILLKKTNKLVLIENRLSYSVSQRVERLQMKLQRSASVLNSLSPLNVVARGYSIVTHGANVVKNAEQVQSGDLINIQLAKGTLEATVTGVRK